MSDTYRRSSNLTSQLVERDPDNLYLARGPANRLPAEMIRDAALAASGLLVRHMEGPPTKPYQPDGLWKEKSGKRYVRDVGPGSHRRSLYTYWKRTSPHPAMMTLDASNREVCVVQRQTTLTPLQVLLMLNDPQYVEAAVALAERAMRNTDPTAENADRERLTYVFRSLVSRHPTAPELEVLVNMLQTQTELFADNPKSCQQVLAPGDYQPSSDADCVALAALAVVAEGLMSYDETVMKR